MCFLLLPEHGRLVVYDWLLLLALLQEEQEVPDIFTEDCQIIEITILFIENILKLTPVGKLLVFRVKLELVTARA